MKNIVLLAMLTVFGVTANAQTSKTTTTTTKKTTVKTEASGKKIEAPKVDGAGMSFSCRGFL